MTFVERRIDVIFSGENVPGGKTLTGHRVSCRVNLAGPGSAGTCSLAIYGMSLSMMNALSIVGYQGASIKHNDVTVLAGDDINGMSEVFVGNIVQAWPDMMSMPQVAFRVEATSGQVNSLKKAEPHSYSGPTKIEVPAQKFAQEMGYAFENNNVVGTLFSPYFKGTLMQQMRSLGKQGRFMWTVEKEKNLAIWPLNGERNLPEVQVSKDTGMVASPVAWQKGIIVKLEFSKLIRQGQPINVETILTEAAGHWKVDRVDLSLDALVPKGEWFTTLYCSRASQ